VKIMLAYLFFVLAGFVCGWFQGVYCEIFLGAFSRRFLRRFHWITREVFRLLAGWGYIKVSELPLWLLLVGLGATERMCWVFCTASAVGFFLAIFTTDDDGNNRLWDSGVNRYQALVESWNARYRITLPEPPPVGEPL
jgi:hypothetical protein